MSDIPKHYSLKEEKDDHFVVHDSRDKSEMQIAKKGVHPATQIKIMKMQKFAEGGEVQEDKSLGDLLFPPDTMMGSAVQGAWSGLVGLPEAAADMRGRISADLARAQSGAPAPNSTPVDLNTLSPNLMQATQAPLLMQGEMATPQADPLLQEAPMDQAPAMSMPQAQAPQNPMAGFGGDLNSIQQQGISGIMGEANALVAQQKQQAQIMQEAQEQQLAYETAMNQKLWDMDVEEENLKQQIAETKIDPERFWNSKDTGSKVSATIGVLLAGIGAGMQGTSNNMALGILNKQIDNDIEAQKMELGKKQNLLADNIRKQGSVQAGVAATRLQMNAALTAKLQIAAAQSGEPIIMERAKQAAAALKAQYFPMRVELAQNQLRQQSAQQAQQIEGMINNAAQVAPDSVPQLIGALEKTNPEKAKDLRERFVPGSGIALTGEGAKGVKEMQATTKTAKDAISRLRQITNIQGKSLDPNLRAEADTLRNVLIGALRVPITGPGAMSEGEREILMNSIPGVADTFSLDSRTKKRLDTLETQIDSKYKRMLQSNGLSPNQSDFRNPMEGKTASDASGNKIIMKNGKWVKFGG